MQKITDRLNADFNGIKAALHTVDIAGELPVFLIEVDHQDSLRQQWEAINNVIAAIYQSELSEEHDFARWNTYVFFLCSGNVDSALRETIEKDTFATRKIIARQGEGTSIDALVDRYISGEAALSLTVGGTSQRTRQKPGNAIFEPPSDIEEIVGEEFINNRMSVESREAIEELFIKLEKELIDENLKN